MCTLNIERHWILVRGLALFRPSMERELGLPQPSKMLPIPVGNLDPYPNKLYSVFKETSKSCQLSHPCNLGKIS